MDKRGPGLCTYCSTVLRLSPSVAFALAIRTPNTDKLSVGVLHKCGNRTLDRFLGLLLDETGSERLEGFVEKFVVQVANREFEGVDFDDEVLDLKTEDISHSR